MSRVSTTARRNPEGRQTPPSRATSRTGTLSPGPTHSKPAPPAARGASSQRTRDVPRSKRPVTGDGTSSELAHDDDEEYSRATREQLIALVKGIKQEKDELSTSLQSAHEAIDEVKERNADLANSLETAQNQSQDYFADQERVDANLADLQQQCDQLRTQLKDSEKARRDLDKRSKEEVTSFEAERHHWLESEKNLKGRIRQLKSRPAPEEPGTSTPPDSTSEEEEPEVEEEPPVPVEKESTAPTVSQPTNPNPELVATLAKLQADFDTLQGQYEELMTQADKTSEELSQLQQSNYSLQDENESFQILLGERTLSGEILGQGVFGQSWDSHHVSGGSAKNHLGTSPDPGQKPKASPRLAEVLEEDELFESHGNGAADSGAVATNGIEKRKSPAKRGKAKAPTSGLDLAAELDRAEESANEPEEDEKAMRRDLSSQSYAEWPEERLISEIKALKDANKALTLYINRIVERVIASEGFEAVLASDAQRASPPTSPSLLNKNRRPPLQTNVSTSSAPSTSPVSSTPADSGHKRASSRMSLSGLASSLFGSKPAQEEPSRLKPLQLSTPGTRVRSGSTSPSRASAQGEHEEEEEESRERDRINAELALLGIEEEAGSPGLRQAQRNSISQTIDRPMPETSMAEQQKTAKDVPLAAIDQISTINERDRQSKTELKSGRASGFTEPRRVSARPRRDQSRSSSLSDFPATGRASEDMIRGQSNGSADIADQPVGWGTKLLRRVSLTQR